MERCKKPKVAARDEYSCLIHSFQGFPGELALLNVWPVVLTLEGFTAHISVGYARADDKDGCVVLDLTRAVPFVAPMAKDRRYIVRRNWLKIEERISLVQT